MLSRKKKLQLLAAFATLLLFAMIVGCNGFFVDPTLTSITVGPTATINQGATVQESAVGTFNDGSTKTLTGVQWSSSSSTVASVSSGGVVTGNAPGTATITGAYQASSGTSSITVTLGNVTALKIQPTTATIAINGGTQTFTALATVQGDSTPQDVSATANWSLSNSTDFTITQGQDPATVTSQSTATAGETVTVTATYQSTTTYTATATLTATQ
jgi:trimeric autotransporter adhesin